ncbi:MAG: hypothetical protein AB8B57_06695 [Congregibacter sp.]
MLHSRRYGIAFVLALPVLVLSACVTPTVAPEPEPLKRAPEDVELTLNLPDDSTQCRCDDIPANDRTFLERGMRTLADADYIEAVQYFQRYKRLEKSAVAQWESQLAIAYISMLPRSPFYDVEAARVAYTDLQAREPSGSKHHTIVLMQQALESFVLMERHFQDLERRSVMLQDDLDKRELAIKRLRELTLGQPEGSP